MGKVLDSLAATMGVQNNNNLQDADKLKLFRSVDGVSISEDTSRLLENLLSSQELFNGDCVHLQYVAEADCKTISITDS